MRDVTELLPHRASMLLVDRILELTPGESVTAIKAVSRGEAWYHRNGSQASPFPAALLLESWGQAAGALSMSDRPPARPGGAAGQVMLFGGGTDIRFLVPVYPGDVVEHHVRVARRFSDTILFTGDTTVDGISVMRVGSLMMALRPAVQVAAARQRAQ
jgi:3-hydroxyacyl-[acyl-carrier-protein] dehydratase